MVLDNSGALDKEELTTMFTELGVQMSANELVSRMLKRYDTDGSFLIEEEEFVAFLQDIKVFDLFVGVRQYDHVMRYDMRYDRKTCMGYPHYSSL
jgi:hypothetical protein